MGGWPGSTLKKKQIKKLIVPSERDLFFLRKEFCFRSDESDFWLMIVPASFFLFYITTHIEIKNSNKYFVLRQMSSLIYFLHHFIIFSVLFINKLSLHFLNGDLQIGWFLCWVITTTVSVAVSYIIVKLSQKPRLKFLKILYT